MKKIETLFLLFITILIMGTACSESNSEKNTALQDEPREAQLKDVNAEQIQEVIASYEGEKAVLVNVWATWCVPCVEEFPEIVKIQEKYPEQLRVVFISADFPEDRKRAQKFLNEHNVNWTTYFKNDKDEPFINALSEDWSGALPFTKIINKNGEEVAHWENKASFDTFNKNVQKAINL